MGNLDRELLEYQPDAAAIEAGGQIPNAWICLIPIGLFYLLDCYYLGLERLCISSQKSFLERISNNAH